jgi:hypothetical protein
VPNDVTLVPIFQDSCFSIYGDAVYRAYSNSLVRITKF